MLYQPRQLLPLPKKSMSSVINSPVIVLQTPSESLGKDTINLGATPIQSLCLSRELLKLN
jgi:hypothetical protein